MDDEKDIQSVETPAPEPEYGTSEYEAKHNPLGIAEEDIWTYRIDGLAKPHINKPFDNARRNKIIFIVLIVMAISVSCFFSVRAVTKETFEYDKLKDNSYELIEFRNTSYIKEITINYVIELKYDETSANSHENFTLSDDTSKPVTVIREYAFNCDEYLEVINIGANVKEIDGKSFYTCRALQRIEVDEDNEFYCDVDGVLFNKDKTEIICYPMEHDKYLRAKYGHDDEEEGQAVTDDVLTYVVPSTVKKIGELCFNYTKLENVYLPEGLTEIGTLGFFKAEALSGVYSYKGEYADTHFVERSALGEVYLSLPDGLTKIGSDAFCKCRSMTYVYIPESVTYIGHHAFWDCVIKEDKELVGVTEINVAVDKETFKKCERGDQWQPKYDHLLFMKKVPINYSAERAEM